MPFNQIDNADHNQQHLPGNQDTEQIRVYYPEIPPKKQQTQRKVFRVQKIAFWIIQNCENLDGMENLRLEMGLQKHWRI